MGVHFIFVAVVLLGGLVVWYRPRFAAVHAPVFAYAVVIEAVRFQCPLTLIEKNLRALAGLENYTRGFLGHYVEPWLVAAGLPQAVYAHMGYWTVGLNALLYVWLARRCWTARRTAGPDPVTDPSV